MDPLSTSQDLADSEARSETSPGLTIFRLVTAVLWTIAIMTLCWLPPSVVREVEKDSSWFRIPNLDKLIHWGLFCIFSVLWMRVRPSRLRFLWVGLGGLALAALTEVVQGLPIVGRDTSLADGVTDMIGVVIGIAVAPLVEPLLRFLESRIFRGSAS